MTTSHSGAPERSVVDRTLSILGAFDRDNRTLTLTDISRRSGLPVATVHRIVTKLTGWGALERDSDGGYNIGLRLWETAVLAPRGSSLAEAAQPHLVELHRQTSAGATIAIRDGAESVCLSLVTNRTDLAHLHSDPGGRLPLHASSVGLVLLAHAGEPLRSAVCAGPLPAYTPATITDGAALGRCLVRIRREGHALVRNTLTVGKGGLAVPVRDGRGAIVAAVGAVGPVELVQPVRLLPHVRAAAEAIARAVRSGGWRDVEVGT
ncbi:IclR family transcriptional regulator [Streptomyces sp. NPDC005728]|uniref:IclR family transcriptional regulator n=1 Tax=Streptomyces sp. NPDC005728 TaxID=3157054 RepID=UPI00340BD359